MCLKLSISLASTLKRINFMKKIKKLSSNKGEDNVPRRRESAFEVYLLETLLYARIFNTNINTFNLNYFKNLYLIFDFYRVLRSFPSSPSGQSLKKNSNKARSITSSSLYSILLIYLDSSMLLIYFNRKRNL